MQISPLGDSALIVRVCDELGDEPALVLDRVLTVQRRIKDAHVPGVIEIAPAYTTVAVFFDPTKSSAPAGVEATHYLSEQIRAALGAGDAPQDSGGESRCVTIPVCYGEDHGPDLEFVAQHTGLSIDEVVRRHTEAEYRVHALGFSPGFPYLGGLPPELAVPRRAVPRTSVPAGSVGIGGAQTGIYPQVTPGGWHIIGRTPLRLFAAEANPPAFLRAGDRVRFQAVSREEFDQWR